MAACRTFLPDDGTNCSAAFGCGVKRTFYIYLPVFSDLRKSGTFKLTRCRVFNILISNLSFLNLCPANSSLSGLKADSTMAGGNPLNG